MAMIKDNVARIRGQIASICQRIGRNPDEITLVAATKYADAAQIKEAIEAGITDIGENKVQEAQEKFSRLGEAGGRRHMIGHLQTNKVKLALQLFDIIQSVDSLKLAQEIDSQAAKLKAQVKIFIEVNTSGEEQKFGVEPKNTIALIKAIGELSRIEVCGLMTMAPFVEDSQIIRRCFSTLRQMRDQVNEAFGSHPWVKMDFLSMGMSEDFEIAIEEGSNMVRIGRAIFVE